MTTTLTLKSQATDIAPATVEQGPDETTVEQGPDETTKAEPPAANYFAALLGKRRWVKTVHGDMLHLFTNVWLTSDPKKIEVDQFVINQLEAKKMALHKETDD